MGSNAEPIRTQPLTTGNIGAIPDLNKLIHLRGMTLYTDIFSRPEWAPGADKLQEEMNQENIIVTSMYLRRQQSIIPTKGELDNFASTVTSTVFQSCYTSALAASVAGTSNPLAVPLADDLDDISTPSTMTATMSANPPRQNYIPSNPVQFASFVGEKQTVRLRLKNTQLSALEGINTKV